MSSRSEALSRVETAVRADYPLLSAFGWAGWIARTAWIVDYLDDVASDLSAFHRIDDPLAIDSVRFFQLATRVGAYAGAVQAIALEHEQQSSPSPSARQGAGQPREVDDNVALAELVGAGMLEVERG